MRVSFLPPPTRFASPLPRSVSRSRFYSFTPAQHRPFARTSSHLLNPYHRSLIAVSYSRSIADMAPVAISPIQSSRSLDNDLEKITVIGSGNWGSAIARIAAMNTLKHPGQFEKQVTMWVNEEQFEGRPLTHIINEIHQNPRYLPGIDLGHNVHAEPDIRKAVEDATALIVVLPHQFLNGVLKRMAPFVQPHAKAVTLIKGVDVQGPRISTFASIISKELNIPCSALSGANIANEVAADLFSESTLGIPSTTAPHSEGRTNLYDRPETKLWKTLFQTPKFRIRVVDDVEGVCLCGALKNVVACAAGFVDGLGWGDNAKAAIMRVGLMEIHDFCLEFFPTTKSSTFLSESCGVADIMTSCMGGRNRKVAVEMVKTGKTFKELEEQLLNGQKLQGPQTAEEIHEFLAAHGWDNIQRPGGYPLFEAVYRICYENMPPNQLTERL